MKNITFSADEALIERAREKARRENKTLNVVFRDWLADYADGRFTKEELRAFWRKASYVRAGSKLTRDEMNAR